MSQFSDFLSKSFCPAIPKNFIGGNFLCCVPKSFGYRKTLNLRRLCHDFLSKLYISQFRNISYVKPFVLCFRKLPLAKKIKDKRGGRVSRFSVKIYCRTVSKTSMGKSFTV